jgi:hypothetical protein
MSFWGGFLLGVLMGWFTAGYALNADFRDHINSGMNGFIFGSKAKKKKDDKK